MKSLPALFLVSVPGKGWMRRRWPCRAGSADSAISAAMAMGRYEQKAFKKCGTDDVLGMDMDMGVSTDMGMGLGSAVRSEQP